MALSWISAKMPYHWQTSWGVQKIKWSFCKRIEFSPLRSIVQPVISFVSEWRGNVAPTTSTSVALIVILRGALGRVFCSWRKFFKSFLVLMFSIELIAGLGLFFLKCEFFLRIFLRNYFRLWEASKMYIVIV